MAKKKIELWPIGIAVAMATFIGGIAFAVAIMMRNDHPLVAEDYYAQEIAYQGRIDKEARAVAEGRQPTMRYLPATDALELTLPNVPVQSGLKGKLTFFRPSDPTQDFAIDLRLDSLGQQWVDLRQAAEGLWVIQVDWEEAGKAYYHEQRISL